MPPNERLTALAHDLSQIGFTLPRFGIGDVVTFAKLNDGPGGLLVVVGVQRHLRRYPVDDGSGHDQWEYTEWQYRLWYPAESKRPDSTVRDHGGFSEWGWIEEGRLISVRDPMPVESLENYTRADDFDLERESVVEFLQSRGYPALARAIAEKAHYLPETLQVEREYAVVGGEAGAA